MKNEFLYLSELASKLHLLLGDKAPILLPEHLEAGRKRYAKLFLQLTRPHNSSEEEVALSAVGLGVQSKEYQNLRSVVKRRMLNTLFHLDLSKGPMPRIAELEYTNAKASFIAWTLNRLTIRSYASHFARQALEVAQRYQFTPVEIEMLNLLRNDAMIIGSRLEYDKYANMHRTALNNQRAEFESATFREQLQLATSRKVTADQKTIRLAMDYAIELDRIYTTYPRFKIGLDYYRVKAIAHQMSMKFDKAIETCDEADAFLQKHPELVTWQPREFALKRLVCALHLRDIETAEKAAANCDATFLRDSENWFIFKEYHFLLQMHKADFQEAQRIFTEVVSIPRFKALPKTRSEMWVLFEHYLGFVLGEFHASKDNKSEIQRKLQRISKDLPIYSKDKTGYNVSLIILQILILLGSRDFASIVNRIEALTTYITRYLKGPATRQSAIFLRLLLLLEKESFNATTAAEKAKPLLAELLATHEDSPGLEGFQVLPYDYVWAKIIEDLSAVKQA